MHSAPSVCQRRSATASRLYRPAIRKLLAKLTRVLILKRNSFGKQSGDQSRATGVQHRLVMIKSRFKPIIGAPPHPFRLRRQRPYVRIVVAYQPLLDPGLAQVRAADGVIELRLVSHDAPPPSLPTAENRSLPVAATAPRRAGLAAGK